MKKKQLHVARSGFLLIKMLRVMKLTFFILCACLVHVSATSFSQQQKVSLTCENELLSSVLKDLEKQTSLYFFFNDNALDVGRRVSLSVKNKELEDVLGMLLGEDYQWEIVNNLIVVTRASVEQKKKEIRICGKVTDEKKQPIPGVTILVKGLTIGTATDMDGKYALTLPEMKDFSLLFSFLGMETQEVKYAGRDTINVVMREDVKKVEEVVVTGYATIRKSSFTGAYTEVKREELLKVSQGNVIAALQVFDPSLRIMENNEMGSDPNTLPEFYVRGGSGISGISELEVLQSETSEYALTANPNLPVFILDGYEVSAEKIYDMDPNLIENITILKDAAATAIYGSRAANGVIVIESVAPTVGKLNVTYNLTGSITQPDLTSYSLMDARGKLEAEVAVGLLDADDPLGLGTTYASRLADWRMKNNYITRGVDTYWLSSLCGRGLIIIIV